MTVKIDPESKIDLNGIKGFILELMLNNGDITMEVANKYYFDMKLKIDIEHNKLVWE